MTLPAVPGHHLRTARPAAVRWILLTVALALLAALWPASPAAAHAALIKSTPAKGATVTPPTQAVLVFSEPLQPEGLTVIVRDAAGTHFERQPTLRGATLTVPLTRALPAGSYTLAYRVVSEDGHPVADEFTFTVQDTGAAATASPQATPAASADTPPAAAATPSPVRAAGSRAQGGVPSWLWVVVGGLAGVLIGVAVALRRRAGSDD